MAASSQSTTGTGDGERPVLVDANGRGSIVADSDGRPMLVLAPNSVVESS